jgi:hypothetical protein
MASILHYEAMHHFELSDDDYTEEGNIEFIEKGNRFSKIKEIDILELKKKMNASDIFVRPVEIHE